MTNHNTASDASTTEGLPVAPSLAPTLGAIRLPHGRRWVLWMAHDRTLCIFVSIGAILFDTFFFVSLFLPRLAPLFFAGASSFTSCFTSPRAIRSSSTCS
jgi:hypothetical protein